MPAAHQAQVVALERLAQRNGRPRISVAELGSRVTGRSYFIKDFAVRYLLAPASNFHDAPTNWSIPHLDMHLVWP
jgi:hypothetical protein